MAHSSTSGRNIAAGKKNLPEPADSTVALEIPFSEEEIEALNAAAKAEGISLSELICQRIEAPLDPDSPTGRAIEALTLIERDIKLLSETKSLCLEEKRRVMQIAEALKEDSEEERRLAKKLMQGFDELHDASADAFQGALECRKTLRQLLNVE